MASVSLVRKWADHTQHDSASESDADTREDEALLLYHFISVVEPLVSESEHFSLTSMTLCPRTRLSTTRLGLPVHVMSSTTASIQFPPAGDCTSKRAPIDSNLRPETQHPVIAATPRARKHFNDTFAWDALPPNMHPTTLQLSDDHHAFFDVFCPWPKVRDRVIRSLRDGLIDQREFCKDLLQHPLASGAPQSLIIWQGGDPADADNWVAARRVCQAIC